MGRQERKRQRARRWRIQQTTLSSETVLLGLMSSSPAKTILSGAKLLLLHLAVFNINFDCLLSKANGQPPLRQRQGCTCDELALVHWLEGNGNPRNQQKAGVEILAMTCLCVMTMFRKFWSRWSDRPRYSKSNSPSGHAAFVLQSPRILWYR